jgi:hypothetical protein
LDWSRGRMLQKKRGRAHFNFLRVRALRSLPRGQRRLPLSDLHRSL